MENSGEWHKYDKLSWLFQIQLVQLNGGSRFRGAGADVTKMKYRGFPGGAVVKNPPANAGDMGSSPGLGGSHMPRSN